MKLPDLCTKLNHAGDKVSILKQLSSVSQKSIARNGAFATTVLQSCQHFCRAASTARQYPSLCVVLNFVHKATTEDAWLSPASTIILPSLHYIYMQVLTFPASTLPSSPARVALTLSEHVQSNVEALRTLRTIFTLVSDFCDVVSPRVCEQLAVFLRCAGAVLFGSNFQRERVSVNETEYAQEELVRYSSFAMCNILTAFPSLRAFADNVLGKRVSAFLNLLYASSELSVQRSLILILKALHENKSETEASPRNLKSQIENGLSANRFGNGAALELFKALDLGAENAGDLGDAVIAKLLQGIDVNAKSFTTNNCVVQMTGRIDGTHRKGGSQKATVDWNKNSVVVRVRNRKPTFFPIYAVSSTRWLCAHREVRLTFNNSERLENAKISIRFKPGGNRSLLGSAIEARLKSVLDKVMRAGDILTSEILFSSGRKSSKSNQRFSDSEEASSKSSEELSPFVVESESGGEIEELGGSSEHGGVRGDEGIAKIPSASKKELDNEAHLFQGCTDAPQETIFDDIGADGILMRNLKKAHDSVERGSQSSALFEKTAGNAEIITLTNEASKKRKADEPISVENMHKNITSKNASNEADVSDTDNSAKDWTDYPAESKVVASGRNCSPMHVDTSACDIPSNSLDISSKNDSSLDAGDQGHAEVEIGESMQISAFKAQVGVAFQVDPTCNLDTRLEERILLENGIDASTAVAPHPSGTDMVADSIMKRGSDVIEKAEAQVDEPGLLPDSTMLLPKDDRMRQKLLLVVKAISKDCSKKKKERTKLLRQSLEQVHKDANAAQQQIASDFRAKVKAEIGTEAQKVAEYERSQTRELSELRAKWEAARKSLMEYKEKCHALKMLNMRTRAKARAQMELLSTSLQTELDGCVKKLRSNADERKKKDQLYLGLCKLLQGDDTGT